METKPQSSQADIVSLIESYACRICPAVFAQHSSDCVYSPLGVWLLLAACVTAASGRDLTALEDALGCRASEAAALLAGFLAAPPRALHTAMALWVRSDDRTTRLVEWSASLPPVIERGPIPAKTTADTWTERQTDGLIQRFPVEISERTRIVLASALATKVSWESPFGVGAAADHLRTSSPWRGQVDQVLLDYGGDSFFLLADTEAAGVVAVHFAQAVEDLGVLSVAADPAVDRQRVVEAAYEVARRCRTDTLGEAKRSLFDLPPGEGASWVITERETSTFKAGSRVEEIEYVVLPAWRSESRLDLNASTLFGTPPALNALFGFIGPSPEGDEAEAAQSTVASFLPAGFEAAAASALSMRVGAARSPTERGIERRARLFFDHPYAALALVGTSSDFRRARAGHTELFCLPLFSAWVETPSEPQMTSSPLGIQ